MSGSREQERPTMPALPGPRAAVDASVVDAEIDRRLLDVVFDRAPMGIAAFDADGCLLRCNTTWIGFLVQHLGLDESDIVPGRSIYGLLLDEDGTVEQLVETVLRGETVRRTAIRLENLGDVTHYWDVVFAPTVRDERVVGFVEVVTDATERVVAYEQLDRRIRAFAQVASTMTVDQPLGRALQALTETAIEVSDAKACAILIVDPGSQDLVLFAAAGLPEAYGQALTQSWREGVQSPSRQALVDQRLAVVHGARAQGLANPKYEPLYPYLREVPWDDMVIVPLDSRGRSLGVLQYYYQSPVNVDDDELAFMTSLADQAALAVANANLYAASERTATLVERQRLARELHDSVSQALFSMTLHVRAAERHLAAPAPAGNTPALAAVQKLGELTRGALAEMRALIFELRPGALGEEGLAAAVTRQAAALTVREAVPITVTGPSERPALDPDAEEHLYRLVLEALNNAVKHARASHITVNIGVTDQTLTVVVADDGVGFDPSAEFPGHLGQQTMADRAAQVGGRLQVDSVPGAGTSVTVTVALA